MNKRIGSFIVGALIAASSIASPPPQLTKHANAVDTSTGQGITWEYYDSDQIVLTNINKNLSTSGATQIRPTSPSYISNDGYCTGTGNQLCESKVGELCRWSFGITPGSQTSAATAGISTVYRCVVCGQEFSGPSSSSPKDGIVFPRYYTASGSHKWKNMATNKSDTLTLCTDNLVYETHGDSYKVLKEANHRWYCSCGTLRTIADMYGCSKCGYIAATGAKHLDGSQTSSGCGSNIPITYLQHTYLNITSCPTHPKAGATVHYATPTMVDGYIWYAVATNQPSEDQRINARKGTLATTMYAHHYVCTICGTAVGDSSSDLHKSQEVQTITATLNPTSVGYGCTCPALTVKGAQTSLTYASSDSNTATISSTGVISLVGVGTTKFTITAAETLSWTSATATATLTVTKGDLKVKTVPTASSISYGQSLTSSSLTGGSVTNGSGVAVGGSFAWKSPGTVPDSGGSKVYVVRFTPTEVSKYNY